MLAQWTPQDSPELPSRNLINYNIKSRPRDTSLFRSSTISASGLDESEVWLAIPIENLIMSYPDARAMDTAGQPGTALKKSDQLQHQIETEGYIALSQLDHLGFCIGLEIRERI